MTKKTKRRSPTYHSLTFKQLLAVYRASPPEARARFLARLNEVEEK
jgi:hypothetical protein